MPFSQSCQVKVHHSDSCLPACCESSTLKLVAPSCVSGGYLNTTCQEILTANMQRTAQCAVLNSYPLITALNT